MLSVLKQEFKIHKKNIFITAIIFAAIYLCTIFSMHLSGLFESEKIQDISALWFGLSVGLGCIGAFFILYSTTFIDVQLIIVSTIVSNRYIVPFFIFITLCFISKISVLYTQK